VTYFNTTAAAGVELNGAERRATAQEAAVLDIFRRQPDTPLSPFQVWAEYTRDDHATTPLTSVRRAISDLTEQGHLIRTNDKRLGPYRRKEYLWRLATSRPTSQQGD
jgi:Fe2+ or Zn2+ uptake regulation protein